MSNSIKDSAQAFAVNQVLKYVDSNPQEAFPRLLDWADKFDKDDLYLTQRQTIRKIMDDPDSNWMRLINSFWTDIDAEVRKVFFRNFIVNASLLGSRKQIANREKYGCNIPWAILMDPTSACNLHCTGCWAAEYGNRLNLTYEELDDIINIHVPENREALKTARAHGDFRENAEFDAAKERRNFLTRRRNELERDLGRVNALDFATVKPTEFVDLGVTVTLEIAGSADETYYYLGAWDGNPEKNYLSYKTKLGEVLRHHQIGDAVTLPDGRNAKIKAIEALPESVLADMA